MLAAAHRIVCELDSGEGAIKVHVAATFQVLGACNRTEAMTNDSHLTPAFY